MRASYRYNRGPKPHHVHRFLDGLIIVAILLGAGAGGWWWLKHRSPSSKVVEGAPVSVRQKNTAPPSLNISEPTFTMQLPHDWKEIGRQTKPYNFITWNSTAKNADNRRLTIYIDTIPQTAVNMELPLNVHGNQLTYGQLSGNCSDFTPGGTENVGQAEKLAPKQSVWNGVNFICNLPQVVDDQVGTGSGGSLNTVTVSGPKAGTHRYFFLYVDHNVAPDYTILFNAIDSFRAK